MSSCKLIQPWKHRPEFQHRMLGHGLTGFIGHARDVETTAQKNIKRTRDTPPTADIHLLRQFAGHVQDAYAISHGHQHNTTTGQMNVDGSRHHCARVDAGGVHTPDHHAHPPPTTSQTPTDPMLMSCKTLNHLFQHTNLPVPLQIPIHPEHRHWITDHNHHQHREHPADRRHHAPLHLMLAPAHPMARLIGHHLTLAAVSSSSAANTTTLCFAHCGCYTSAGGMPCPHVCTESYRRQEHRRAPCPKLIKSWIPAALADYGQNLHQ